MWTSEEVASVTGYPIFHQRDDNDGDGNDVNYGDDEFMTIMTQSTGLKVDMT